MRNGSKKQGGAGHFAETNPRTLVGLQKSRVQLDKELTKLEKQAKTSVSNIANHQQAMKMSWRRLEQSRNQESPLLSRGGARRKEEELERRKMGLLHSNTKLYVKATPSIYDADSESPPSGNTGSEDLPPPPPRTAPHPARVERSSHPPPSFPNPASSAYHRGSPYLSSPYNIRRSPRQPSWLSESVPPPGTQSPPSPPSQTTPLHPPGTSDDKERSSNAKRSDVKLPPLYNSSQPLLVAHSNTVDKGTLMKASALLEGGSDQSSHGPGSFKDFYGSSQRPPSRNILMSPQGIPPPEWAELLGSGEGGEAVGRGAEGGEEGGVLRTNSEPTLAELFEQIKHCRYIRHYHPDGTEKEDYY